MDLFPRRDFLKASGTLASLTGAAKPQVEGVEDLVSGFLNRGLSDEVAGPLVDCISSTRIAVTLDAPALRSLKNSFSYRETIQNVYDNTNLYIDDPKQRKEFLQGRLNELAAGAHELIVEMPEGDQEFATWSADLHARLLEPMKNLRGVNYTNLAIANACRLRQALLESGTPVSKITKLLIKNAPQVLKGKLYPGSAERQQESIKLLQANLAELDPQRTSFSDFIAALWKRPHLPKPNLVKALRILDWDPNAGSLDVLEKMDALSLEQHSIK